MSKRHRLYLPSLTKTSDNKLEVFPIYVKLDKQNIELLNKHGYETPEELDVVKYKILPQEYYSSFLLFLYILFQDLIKGKIINSHRKAYHLLFKSQIYQQKLTEKEAKIVEKHLGIATLEDMEGNSYSSIPKQKKIVLLSSDGVGVGKTTLANKLVEELSKNSLAERIAFMDSTRDQLSFIFEKFNIVPDVWYGDYYTNNKNKKIELAPYKDLVLRDFLCDYSDLLQKHLGNYCWALNMVFTIEDSDAEYIIIDDLRREIELHTLQEEFGSENIVSVYLTKKDKQEVTLSTISSNYEGQLDPSTFDIQFEYDADWTNTQELIDIIKTKINS